MKYAKARVDGAVQLAVVEDGVPVITLNSGNLADLMDVAIRRQLMETATPITNPAAVQLLAPIVDQSVRIFCVGKNYVDHALEYNISGYDRDRREEAIPTSPIIFNKLTSAVIASGEAIVFDSAKSTEIDYEGELGVVIGTGGKNITRGMAKKHVFGYTVVNDVTARDVQRDMKQWLIGKSLDTFCPIGPWIVEAGEFRLNDSRLRTWVNGELRQDAKTDDFIFDIGTIIERVSQFVSLYPGDIIAMGTPVGVGIGMQPPRFLKDGDTVKVEISGIGTLQNRVVELHHIG